MTQSVIKGEPAHPNSKRPEKPVSIEEQLRVINEKLERIDRLARLVEAHPLIRRFLNMGGR